MEELRLLEHSEVQASPISLAEQNFEAFFSNFDQSWLVWKRNKDQSYLFDCVAWKMTRRDSSTFIYVGLCEHYVCFDQINSLPHMKEWIEIDSAAVSTETSDSVWKTVSPKINIIINVKSIFIEQRNI